MTEHKQLRFENPRDQDNFAEFIVRPDGTLMVTVGDEKAVDSYNSYFECYFDLTAEQVATLKAWLPRMQPR